MSNDFPDTGLTCLIFHVLDICLISLAYIFLQVCVNLYCPNEYYLDSRFSKRYQILSLVKVGLCLLRSDWVESFVMAESIFRPALIQTNTINGIKQ